VSYGVLDDLFCGVIGSCASAVPDEVWELAAPSIPRFAARRQGGGTASLDDRLVFTAIAYVLTSGCSWRHLPGEFRVTRSTAHRRFTAWTEAGLWDRLHLHSRLH